MDRMDSLIEQIVRIKDSGRGNFYPYTITLMEAIIALAEENKKLGESLQEMRDAYRYGRALINR